MNEFLRQLIKIVDENGCNNKNMSTIAHVKQKERSQKFKPDTAMFESEGD